MVKLLANFGSIGKESACNARDLGSIPGLGRFPAEGKGYSLQHSGLGNSMDCIVYGVAESDMTEQLSLHSKQGLWHHVPTKTTAGRAPVPMAGHY